MLFLFFRLCFGLKIAQNLGLLKIVLVRFRKSFDIVIIRLADRLCRRSCRLSLPQMVVNIDSIQGENSIFGLEFVAIQFFHASLNLKLVIKIVVFNAFWLSKLHVSTFLYLLKIALFYTIFLILFGHDFQILFFLKNLNNFLNSSY